MKCAADPSREAAFRMLKRVLSNVRVGVALLAAGAASGAEPSAAPVLRIEAGMHTATIRRVVVDEAGRLVLTASTDRTARLWELPSGQLRRVLRPPIGEGNEGKLYACALSADGSFAAVGGWTGFEWDKSESIYLFDTGTGQMVRRFPGLPNVINDIAFSGQGRFLAAVLGGGQGLRVWETRTGVEVGQDAAYDKARGHCVDWCGEERLVTTSYDGSLRLYEVARAGSSKGRGGVKLSLRAKVSARGGMEPFGARFSPDGRHIIVGFNDTTKVAVHDGHFLGFQFAPDTTAVDGENLGAVAWSRDGMTLAAAGTCNLKGAENAIRFWSQAGRGQPRDCVATSNTIMDLRALPGGGILYGAGDPAWGMIDARGEHTLLGASPLANFHGLGERFKVSPDGTVIAFAYEKFGQSPARFSIAARELSAGEPAVERMRSLSPPRTTGLPVTDWEDTTLPRLADKPLPLEPYEGSRCLAVKRDNSGFVLGTDYWLRSFAATGVERWKVREPGTVWAVNLADDDGLVVVACGDGTIRWHRAEDGRELLAFFPHADRERWVMWTPQGCYDCSPGGEELIGWHVNRGKDQAADFQTAAKFREQFHRPEIIQRALVTRDSAEGNDAPALRLQRVR